MAEKLIGEEEQHKHATLQKNTTKEIHLLQLLQFFILSILFPKPGNTVPLLHRIKTSLARDVPLIPEASRNTAHYILLWTRAGTPLRSLLVISVGTITLVSLTGLLVFMLFVLAATINAVVISLLISLAAAGGFLALFFAFVTAIYIGALSVAIFAISTAVFWTTVAILITTGWVAFFYTVWLATSKSLGFAKHSLSATGSAITTYSASWGTRNLPQKD
ncbi:hypothetical protein TanjilG_29419 [Lupinus angustifolius]|uniref:Uncharacterized protein n=1 Tax=Lupinus angustifolius TaxID=3871 RepID=A0A4P1R5V3_LUPAN|nr:PREDICTED: uncharacterized protein LOC109360448 [Lupinus angustifolius]OIW02643.1 hypothetical protein TanjilG_29419 [Lupinus angustifolius]